MRSVFVSIFVGCATVALSAASHAAVCDVKAMGAKGDGKTKDTAVIQAAMTVVHRRVVAMCGLQPVRISLRR